jgi:hypothetical protein
MAADPPKKKAITDWINRPRQDKPDITEQRRKLWEALTAFIHSNGGHVVSLPGAKNLRVEVPCGSSLPAATDRIRLQTSLLWHWHQIITRQHAGRYFSQRDVIEVTLGK